MLPWLVLQEDLEIDATVTTIKFPVVHPKFANRTISVEEKAVCELNSS
jgi:hypothetical protein